MTPPDSTIYLDRHRWDSQVQRCEPEFNEVIRTDADHARELGDAIETTIARLDLPPQSALLLSGGRDSRGIIAHLRDRSIPTVTWGAAGRRNDLRGDGHVAAELARHFGHPHVYLNTDANEIAPAQIIERYVSYGEGRADRLTGYTDGFRLWQRLYEQEIALAIRGDVAFGFKAAATELKMRDVLGLRSLLDFANLPEPETLGLADTAWPDWMQRRPGETIARWRDRLHFGYRHANFLAALHDPKLCFVEIVSPLLYRRILNIVQTLPDRLRTDKFLYRQISNRLAPEVPFATESATLSSAAILAAAPYREAMREELRRGSPVLPDTLLRFLLSRLQHPEDEPATAPVRRTLRVLVPKKIRRLVPVTPRLKMNFNIMALRATLISSTHRMLEADAKAGAAAANVSA